MASRRRALLTVVAVALVGCSGTLVETPPPFDPHGEWFGVWAGENGSGALDLDFYLDASQGGASQAVALSARGGGCGSAGDIGEGSYSREMEGVTFFVTIRDASSPSQEASGVTFVGRATDNVLEGEYYSEAFGSCEFCGCPFGLTGSWSAVRVR